MNEEDNILELKMILLGDSAVGKTSIINRYVDDKFSGNIITSTTMSFTQKILTINKQNVQLNIWDTVGQEKFRALSKLFFKDTKIVVLVYSIISKKTFESLDYWLNLFKETIGDDVVLGVAANKSDLFLEQEVDEQTGEEFAQKHGAIFEMVSAKENKLGLDNYINKLVSECLKRNPNLVRHKSTLKLLQLNEGESELKAGCCTGGKNKRVIRKYSGIVKDNRGILNIMFLGEYSSGKTSIINRINNLEFNIKETHTDELIKSSYNYNKGKMKLNVIINDVDNDKKKYPQFIDTIRNSCIFFLVYDVTDNQSLENITYWIEVINSIKENKKKDLFYILANKNDKNKENQNSTLIEHGKHIAEENNALFKAISAKDNEGIEGIIDSSVEYYLAMT